MVVLAIDPGNTESAYVLYDADSRTVKQAGKVVNTDLLSRLKGAGSLVSFLSAPLAIEMIASYGMPVGASVFETCVWIGRFIEAWAGPTTALVYRQEVKLHICKSPKANDATIRKALLDLWGGKDVAIGRKKSPGPLYGIKADVWSALAIAITYAERPVT